MTPTFLVARGGPCGAESTSPKRTITPPYAGKHSHNRHRSARLDAQKSYAGTPTIGNVQSLWFPFHSPDGMKAGQRGVERRPPVQKRSELQAHEATMLRCLAVESGRLGKVGPDRAMRRLLHSWHPTQGSRRSPCVHVNGKLRPLVSRLSGCDLLLRQELLRARSIPRPPTPLQQPRIRVWIAARK